MLTELQGANHPPVAPQARASVPASSSLSHAVPDTSGGADARAASISNAVTQQAPKVQPPKPIDIKVDIEKMRANLQESLEKVNQLMRDGGRSLNFSMDEKLGGMVILVKNAETGEVVRQIPSDAVLRMAHSMEDFKGMLHNELS
jgi:flagellar protein FlaG